MEHCFHVQLYIYRTTDTFLTQQASLRRFQRVLEVYNECRLHWYLRQVTAMYYVKQGDEHNPAGDIIKADQNYWDARKHELALARLCHKEIDAKFGIQPT
ncbi:unnamed protein product [Didymodactylos carnosus]|uniref:Uncharacterized protein n=1 Tax=Didymodactylos carnosus TaxID=1234261 RepID=A0A815NA55_9BILA|nr:unnamed protein product [Didymodactylos carnosus]CAF1563107.1 unnamed protein product [Didymodactylos carnosus]CAF4311787.1 unnamed protein product [Didymodactylos carnosus]CAF4355440.1 unnamed protein product [Didymodactylos carnosus]